MFCVGLFYDFFFFLIVLLSSEQLAQAQLSSIKHTHTQQHGTLVQPCHSPACSPHIPRFLVFSSFFFNWSQLSPGLGPCLIADTVMVYRGSCALNMRSGGGAAEERRGTYGIWASGLSPMDAHCEDATK